MSTRSLCRGMESTYSLSHIRGRRISRKTSHIITDPGLYPTTITLTAPAAAARGSQLAVSGTLSSPFRLPPAGTPLTISRSDAGGIHLLPDAPMAADRVVLVQRRSRHWGSCGFRCWLRWRCDPARQFSPGHCASVVATYRADVERLTRGGRVRSGGYPAGALGANVQLAHSQRVRDARRAGREGADLDCGERRGRSHPCLRDDRNAVFTARFAGDYQYAAVSVTGKATSATRVTQRQTGYHATSGSYRLYRTNVHPEADATIAPAHRGSCVYFSAQRLYSGAWHTIATSGCFALNSSSAATAYLSVKPVRGSPYRFRATFKGDAVSTAASGGWQYFKFD